MNKLIILLLFLSTYITSLSAYVDTDLDGVSDIKDRCPNTLITDLVDMNGCSIKSLENPHHFDIITGLTYSSIKQSDIKDTTNINLQLDYYYQKFSLQLVTSYQDSNTYNGNNINDPYLAGFYNFTPYPNLQARIGFGVIIPIDESEYTTNNTDLIANINLSYSYNKYNFFSGYSYTNINDKDETLTFRDISSFNLGAGFYIKENFYTSLAYNNAQSMIKNSKNTENLSLYLFYSFTTNWFATLSYEYYLDDSMNTISAKIGYYF